MTFTILIICFFLILSNLSLLTSTHKITYDLDNVEEYFEEFIKDFQKSYASEIERQIRFEIFKGSLKMLNYRNEMNQHAEFGISMFSDLTKNEFIEKYGCSSDLDDFHECSIKSDEDVTTDDAPDEYDWREYDKVTEVKKQSDCGCCWAFSIVGNVEGQYAIKHNKLVDLSVQQLLDCDKQNNGCAGGSMVKALGSLVNIGGIETEESYPYEAKSSECRFDKDDAVETIKECTIYDTKDENKLKEILYTVGPLSIGIDSSDIVGYKGGILSDCKYVNHNHAVLLVGYGTEDGVDYWIFKNSWGKNFGEEGYFRVTREGNVCGLLNESIATVVIE